MFRKDQRREERVSVNIPATLTLKSRKTLQGKIIRVFLNDNVRVAAIFVID
jgi:hypothetical protein